MRQKRFAHERDIRLFLLVRQKEATAHWPHTDQIEIVCRHDRAVQLHGIAHAGKNETDAAIRRDAGENSLAIAIMREARHRERHLRHLALLCFAVNADDSILFLKRKTAQKKIFDQSENRAVSSDAECERENGDQAKTRRLNQNAESIA